MNKKIKMAAFLCLFVLLFHRMPLSALAEPKEAEIVTLTADSDLIVMFTFDRELTDITFISPSGARFSPAAGNAEMEEGNLWRTYKITNAEAGAWSVEYELGRNTEIGYSVIEEDYGLWIQRFTAAAGTGAEYAFTFQTDYVNNDIYYDYVIYAIDTADETMISEVAKSRARAGEEETETVDLSRLPSGEYVFRLEVYYSTGDAEVFDSMKTDPVQYKNPSGPQTIEDFKVSIDMSNHLCETDWTEYASYEYEAYKLVVMADGEQIYNYESESDVTASSILFSEGTKSIEIKLAFKSRDIWSAYKVKAVSLDEEYLKNLTGDVTGSAMFELGYKAVKDRVLTVRVGEEEGNYKIKDEGLLSFDLQSGVNEIYAEMESDDLVLFVMDAQVFVDTTGPSIILYDDLDGCTVAGDGITVLGKVTGSHTLYANGEQVALDDTGAFAHEVTLSPGKNTIELVSEDVNGNAATRIVTLYKGSGPSGPAGSSKWLSYLPLMISAGVGVVIILLSVLFLKKKDPQAAEAVKTKKAGKRGKLPLLICLDVVTAGLAGVCLWQFADRYGFNHSLKYLELAEQSAAKAVSALSAEKLFLILMIVFFVLFAVGVLLTILLARRQKKKKQTMENQ